MAELVATAAGTAAYNRDIVEALAAGEPDWLRGLRLDAFAAYERLPVPTTRLEEWRYTDPRMLKWDVVEPADPSPQRGEVATSGATTSAAGADASALLDARPAPGRVLQLGGGIVRVELDESLQSKGVLLLDLADAAREHGDLVRAHLARAIAADAGKFAALNTALWSAGVFVYVPRGVRIDQPIRIVRSVETGGLAYFPRLLIVAEEGSRVGVVEELVSPDLPEPAFSCGAVEIQASAAAEAQFVSVQRWGRGVHHLSMQRSAARRDANVDMLVVNLGGSVARVEASASLDGPGARTDLLGLYFAEADQHFDHSTRQEHRVPYATSDLLYKGALDGRSRGVFRGLIKVFPKAQRTDAYQTNRNLILSREAEATSLPNLEIEADDVRCSHASTVGQLDREELFYIMSRGVPRREAERLVVFGFFADVLDRVHMQDVVQELRASIEEKIG